MRLALMVLVVLCATALARASATPLDVTAQIETPVGIHRVVLGEGCRFGVVPSIMIVTPPVDGALLVRTEIVRIPDSDPSCAGKMARAAVIYYKSVIGYRGADSFSYQLVPDSGKIIDVELNIK